MDLEQGKGEDDTLFFGDFWLCFLFLVSRLDGPKPKQPFRVRLQMFVE